MAALWDAGQGVTVRQKPLPAGSRSAQSLAPALAELLSEVGWSASDLQAVAVTSGPGSFTGLRVGVTTAKMLAYAAGCGVVEVNTLAAIAQQASSYAATTGPVWAVIDAQRGELFAAKFCDGNEEVPTGILSIDQWLKMLAPGDIVAGPVLKNLAADLPQGVAPADQESWSPRAETIAQLALEPASRGAFTNPLELVPRYHRLSAAEEKALKAESQG